jgi:hypothetical protein
MNQAKQHGDDRRSDNLRDAPMMAHLPTPDDSNSCNVYRELRFPDEVYELLPSQACPCPGAPAHDHDRRG